MFSQSKDQIDLMLVSASIFLNDRTWFVILQKPNFGLLYTFSFFDLRPHMEVLGDYSFCALRDCSFGFTF